MNEHPNNADAATQRVSEEYLNLMNGKVRMWPYGTRYEGTITHVDSMFVVVLVLIDDRREAFVLTGVSFEGVEVEQKREIVFKSGGPIGGYWDFA